MVPLLLGILIGALAISSVSTALPAIRGDLALSDTEGLWLADVYALSLAATLIVAARIGDAFGRKRIVLIGLAGFAALNAIGGFAQSGVLLIVIRALLGVAEAFVVAGVVATIGAKYHARERVLAYGLWTATFGVGSALGPVLGGLLAEGPGWRWLLWGSVPLAVLAGVLALWLVPDSRSSRPPSWDVASIVTSIVALGALAFALHEALAAPVPATVAGVIAVGSLVFFVLRQRRLSEPLIDMRLFGVPGFSPAIIRILAASGVSSAAVLLVSLHLQDTRGWSPAEAGLAILPQAAAIAIGGVIAPIALRWMRAETLTVVALLLQAAGMGWLFTDPEFSWRRRWCSSASGSASAPHSPRRRCSMRRPRTTPGRSARSRRSGSRSVVDSASRCSARSPSSPRVASPRLLSSRQSSWSRRPCCRSCVVARRVVRGPCATEAAMR